MCATVVRHMYSSLFLPSYSYDPWGWGKYKGVVLDPASTNSGGIHGNEEDDGQGEGMAAPAAVPYLGGVNRNANGNAWAVPTTVGDGGEGDR